VRLQLLFALADALRRIRTTLELGSMRGQARFAALELALAELDSP
jgi:hypothetical protein